MGLGVAIRNLFHNIFGKKKSGSTDVKITQEIRLRAKELGITPEEYIKITKENGSVWNAGNTESGAEYYDAEEADLDVIDTIRSNLREKYSELGVPVDDLISGNKPTFGLISRSRPVTDAESIAEGRNFAAQNFFQHITSEVEDDIFRANQEVTAAEQNAVQNNYAASHQFTETQTNAENNNAQAIHAQQETEETVRRKNETAQRELTNTQQQTEANNNEAKQKTAQANDYSNVAAQTVIRSQEQLNTANQKLQQAQAAATSSDKTSPEASAGVEQAKKERDNAQVQLDKAKKDEQKAKQDLDATKKQEEETKQKGQEQVSESTRQVERKTAEGEQSIDSAKEETEKVKKQGNESMAAAKENVAETQATGEQAVQTQQNNAVQVTQTGQNDIKKAQAEVDGTKQQGIIEVDAAKRNTKKEIDTSQTEAGRQLQAAASGSKTAENMRKAADARYQQEVEAGHNTKMKGTEELMPNGKINDKVPYQEKVNNCWAHSGVTSLASTSGGKAMLEENIYRDKEKGVTAVHLKEAEQNGKGYGKTGVYTFTDREIAEGAARFGSGDGDTTAYMLATEKYLQEKGEHNDRRYASDYNHNCRMYEIISGEKYKSVTNTSIIPQGISWSDYRNNNMFNYETLCQGIKSGNISGTLGFRTAGGGGHLLSIVGVAPNGNLLVQDPMNDRKTNDRFSRVSDDGRKYFSPFKESRPINGAPTYELTKEMYNKYALDSGIYRYKRKV